MTGATGAILISALLVATAAAARDLMQVVPVEPFPVVLNASESADQGVDVAATTVATVPAASATLQSQEVNNMLVTAGFPQAPPDVFADKAEPADASTLAARVASEKAEVLRALESPELAWRAYKARLGAQVTSARTTGARLSPSLDVFARSVFLPSAAQPAPTPAQQRAEARRAAIFKANLARIAADNAASGPDLAFGITDYTHMSRAEFKQAYLVELPQRERHPAGIQAQDAGTYQNQCSAYSSAYKSYSWTSLTPPSTIDWSSYTTRIKNQGTTCGSCAAFAATAAIETSFIVSWAKNGFTSTNTDLSEQDFLDCTTNNQCAGGWPDWYLQDAVCGIRYESQVPYRATDTGSCSRTLPRYTSGFTKYTTVSRNELGVARALMVNPATIAIGAGGQAQNWAFQNYKAGVWSCGNIASSVDHAIAVVGYRKNVAMASGATWNVFRAKNSWGENWGEQGYVRLRADCGGTGALLMYANAPALPMRQG